MKGKKAANFLKAFILPALFYLVFAVLSKGRLLTMNMFLTILQQSVYPAIVAFAIFCAVEMGLWDLTPGSIIIASSVIGGNFASQHNLGVVGLVCCVLVLCVGMTLLNCTVQYVTRIPSMITSAGMVMIYESVASTLYKGTFSAPRAWTFFSRPPYCYIILLICFVVMYLLINRTKFGYSTRQLGRGMDIAVNSGVNVRRIMYQAYLLSGVMLTFAALIYLAMNGSANGMMNLASTSIGFNAIVAVLVGQYLAMYCGPLFGIGIGTLTLRILGSGLLALGLDATWQRVANGLFLIFFLGFSQNQKLVEEMRLRKKKVTEIMTRISLAEENK